MKKVLLLCFDESHKRVLLRKLDDQWIGYHAECDSSELATHCAGEIIKDIAGIEAFVLTPVLSLKFLTHNYIVVASESQCVYDKIMEKNDVAGIEVRNLYIVADLTPDLLWMIPLCRAQLSLGKEATMIEVDTTGI